MNRTEVAAMLGAASAVDPKVPQPDPHVLAMWAAILDDVPAPVAADAVREHYRRTGETIMPADIVEHWRAVRRETAERQHNAAIRARARRLDDNGLRAIRSGIIRVTAALAAARGTNPQQAEGEADARRAYLAVPCPYCRAQPGHQCTGPGGRTLRRIPAHPGRVDAAGSTTAEGKR